MIIMNSRSLTHRHCAIVFGIVVAVFCMGRPGLSAPQVYRDHVTPHWFDGGERFWYRNDLADNTKEFVVVDAAKGQRHAAFDQARLAASLGKAMGKTLQADRLPIDDLNFDTDSHAVILRSSGKSWRVDLQTYEVRPDESPSAVSPSDEQPHASRSTGAQTTITFENRTRRPVEIFWLDFQNKRQHYVTLKPTDRWSNQTFVGHVWLAATGDGRTLGVYEATASPRTAIISGRPGSDAPTRRRRGRFQNDQPELRRSQSPDGKWLLQVRDDNLVLHPQAGGEDVPLSIDGKPGDGYALDRVWWSPDSANVVAMRMEEGQEHKIYTVESSPPDQVQPKLRVLDYLKAGDRIDHPRPQLFHIATHEHVAIKQDLFPNPWSIEAVRWAADSSRFTFVYNQRGHQVLRVIAVDAASGQARPIVDEHSDTFIDYSGKYFCQWLGDDELIWMSERDGWNHLWLYDAKKGQAKNCITPGDWVVQGVVRVDAEKRQVLIRAGGIHPGQDPYYTQFCRVNLDGSGLTMLTESDGNHAIQWSPDEQFFIDTSSRVDQPPISELRRGSDGHLLCKLEEADASEVYADRGGRWPQRFVAKGRDGVTDIYGVILFPRNFDPDKKYPVLENIYAGPQDFYTPTSFRANYGTRQQLADRGMIVVQCDGMGTSGRSKKFHDVCWKNLRDAGFPDRIPWIKAAAKKYPQMDLSRVGIYGGSAGGQNAMAALLWHHDFYKVAVADCGCHDNRMDKIWWNEQWMGWPVDKSYAENSNVVNAHLLEGKLLLVVGEMDDNVDPSTTMQVVNALEKANKDFQMLVVIGAHHGAAETPYGSRRRMDFLCQNLLEH